MSDQYQATCRATGLESKSWRGDDSRLLRPNLFGVVADQAEDREFIEQGMKLALGLA